MSNYTIAVDWAGKDSLADSDAEKVVSGVDFNTEFTAVQTAVNTKANLNGSASEAFSATKASDGTNTTQVATTSFVKTAITANLGSAYPVGAVFTTITAYANSAAVVTAIGGNTWVAFASGRMLIGINSGDTDFDTAEETGGSKTHTLSTSELPSHTHSLSIGGHTTADGTTRFEGSNAAQTATGTTAATGSGAAHSIMNPYIAVYMWKRTA
tara:strand:- start:549 stop:1184 length:636 start_codon:yes stop_codon:yes gene_type:complete